MPSGSCIMYFYRQNGEKGNVEKSIFPLQYWHPAEQVSPLTLG